MTKFFNQIYILYSSQPRVWYRYTHNRNAFQNDNRFALVIRQHHTGSEAEDLTANYRKVFINWQK